MDENYPNWRSKIDVERFEISSEVNCVLGQVLDGGYYSGTGSQSQIYRHGFDAIYWCDEAQDYGIDISSYGDQDVRMENQYADLQSEWLKVLTA